MKIYPSITTTKGDWRDRIKEAKDLNITEIGFFPTCLKKSEREEAYQLLIKSGIKKIPFIHIRTDMDVLEIEYLIKQFKTEAFNIHTINAHQLEHDLSRFKSIIYVENQLHKFADNELEQWAGICLDTSHLENNRLKKMELYDYFMDLISSHPCGCAHVNAILNPSSGVSPSHYDYHYFNELSDFDYLRKYRSLLPNIVALELENPLSEQIKAKSYIEAIMEG